MAINYEEWCANNKNVGLLVRSMKSSLPEQYIGYYLEKVFGNEIEYQKQFDWLERYSLDIYIPSLQLAIEYDGIYYHANKGTIDNLKTSWCRTHGIYLIHVVEKKVNQEKSRKRNEISYYYEKDYRNIDVAICELCLAINKKCNTKIQIDVDLKRDQADIISYIQRKYYERTIACVWPESKDYWLEEENGLTIFDVFYTEQRTFLLKCPHCGKFFQFHMRYFSSRKSLIPCECEYKQIENSFEEAIRKYKETGEVISLDDSLHGRRLYDRMASVVNRMWKCDSKEEAEMYKKMGFETPYIDVYLSQIKKE